jgi:hypothetical protein
MRTGTHVCVAEVALEGRLAEEAICAYLQSHASCACPAGCAGAVDAGGSHAPRMAGTSGCSCRSCSSCTPSHPRTGKSELLRGTGTEERVRKDHGTSFQISTRWNRKELSHRQAAHCGHFDSFTGSLR